MAVIDSKKLLPPSKTTGSALTTQKFLVPISNIKPKSSAIIRASDITPVENERVGGGKTLLGEVIQIRKNVISIQKIIGDNNTLFKKSEERKRKLLEKEKFAKKEQQLEKKDPKQKTSLSIPSLPRTGFLDAIKRFLFYTLLGAAFVKFGKHIPKILEFSKKLIPAFKFVEDFAGNVLNGVVDFVGAGYKAYDKVREITKQVGGEDLEKKFDEFSKQFNTFANLALIAGMSTMGGSDPFRDRRFNRPSRRGFDRTGRRVSQSAQRRYASRYGRTNFLQRFGGKNLENLGNDALRFKPQQSAAQKLVQKGVTNIAGKRAGAIAGRLPIVGPLIDFGIRKFIFNEPLGKAAAGAVGAAVGQAIGSWIGGAGATALAASSFGLGALAAPALIAGGSFLGGLLGDLIATSLYTTISGAEKPVAKAQGGQVTRGGQRVSGPARRSVKRVRTRPPKIKPQKTIPGKDIGGRKKIGELFYDSPNPNQRNPLGVLETTSKNLKEVPLLGGIMGASVDLAMGQKPDASVFRRIGYGFGALVQNAIDAETSNTIGNIQKEIVGLAGGGAVPRTLSTGESIGMQIGERLGKTLEAMMNSKVTETLQSIRQQFGKEGFGFGPGGGQNNPTPMGDIEYGPLPLDMTQKQAFATIYELAKKNGAKMPELVAGMAMNESTYLKSVLATQANNPFGQTGTGTKGSMKIPGNPRTFAVYNSLEDAIKFHVNNWNNDSQHGKGAGSYGSPVAGLQAILPIYDPGGNHAQYIKNVSSILTTMGFDPQKKNDPVDLSSSRLIQSRRPGASGTVISPGVSSGNFDIVQYITGDVNYRGDGKQFYFDKADHGMPHNYHDHIAFRTEAEKERAKAALRAAGIKLGDEYRPGYPGYHGKNLAIDVPGDQWGGGPRDPITGQHYAGSKKVREVLGLSAFQTGGKVHGRTRAVLGEKGPEFVLDADTTAALEQTYPGFLDALNKADYKGSLQILSNYASYYNPSNSSTIMLQKVIIEKPVPMPMSGGSVASIDNSGTTLPITAFLQS